MEEQSSRLISPILVLTNRWLKHMVQNNYVGILTIIHGTIHLIQWGIWIFGLPFWPFKVQKYFAWSLFLFIKSFGTYFCVHVCSVIQHIAFNSPRKPQSAALQWHNVSLGKNCGICGVCIMQYEVIMASLNIYGVQEY